jgi:RNA polymerase sigma-70 factor (ECF subfamily)
LVVWDGLSPRDAAVVAGCSGSAFRVRLHRARGRVSAQLGIDRDTPNITERLA